MQDTQAFLFTLVGELAQTTGCDAYLISPTGQMACKNGEAAFELPPDPLVSRSVPMEGTNGLGKIAVSIAGQSPERIRALSTTVGAYALLALFGGIFPEDFNRMGTIQRYILMHLSEDLSGQTIASALYISQSTVTRTVKAAAGLPLRLFIQFLRLNIAQGMLLQSDLPIMQVAERCGINDFNYFSRIYKKRFGQTPTQTRALLG